MISLEVLRIMTAKPAFVTDLDDTLLYCGINYENTKQKFYEYMTRFGLTIEEVKYRFNWLETHRQIRSDLTYQHYFPDNMVKLYREWCIEKTQAAVPEIEKEIKDIGYSVYACDFSPMPGAHEMLEELSKDYTLFLYTKGEESIQSKKILIANLDSYFKGVWITDRKTVKILTRFMLDNDLNIRTTWVLGNSPKNDLCPAIEVGIIPENCIWIDSYIWEEDKAQLPEGVHRIQSLDEVVPITRQLVIPTMQG